MKMTKVLLLAFLVMVPLAIQQARAQEAGGPEAQDAGGPEAGGPEAADALASELKAVFGCLDGLAEKVPEFWASMGKGKDVKELGCKLLADQPQACLNILQLLLDLAQFDVGALYAVCGLPSDPNPAYAPLPAN